MSQVLHSEAYSSPSLTGAGRNFAAGAGSEYQCTETKIAASAAVVKLRVPAENARVQVGPGSRSAWVLNASHHFGGKRFPTV